MEVRGEPCYPCRELGSPALKGRICMNVNSIYGLAVAHRSDGSSGTRRVGKILPLPIGG